MLLKNDTIEIQKKLATFCREGDLQEIDGARLDRLPHYRRLVYNVMYGLLEKAFPVCKSILEEAEFKTLVREYMTKHDAQVPQVWKVPGEFYDFNKNNSSELLDKYPYLLDLLLMEWMEILVYNRENSDVEDFKIEYIDENISVVINPESEILEFDYPVFKGDWDKIINKKGKYYLLMFRNLSTHKVHYLEISALYNELISVLKKGLKINEAISTTMPLFGLEFSIEFKDQILIFLNTLHEKGFILGSAR